MRRRERRAEAFFWFKKMWLKKAHLLFNTGATAQGLRLNLI